MDQNVTEFDNRKLFHWKFLKNQISSFIFEICQVFLENVLIKYRRPTTFKCFWSLSGSIVTRTLDGLEY